MVATEPLWIDGKANAARNRLGDGDVAERENREWALGPLSQGRPVYAECRVADGSYKKDGETVYTTDIIANAFHKLDLGARRRCGGVKRLAPACLSSRS